MMRKRGALLVSVAALSLAASTQPAWAWKPKTHVYLAEEVLKDAFDDGKVTIYEVDRSTGKVVGKLGDFDVDPKILKALRGSTANFRAGVLGPDAYPDILTGQQIIHPDESLAHDGSASGSDAWLTHLWKRGFVDSQSTQVQAFTIGFLTHAAGDIFAHTYVNYFAGGEFMLTPDPTNAVKHLVLEGYIGKRTPTIMSADTSRVRVGGPLNDRKREDLGLDPDVGGVRYQTVHRPISQADTSIAGVESFIYQEMINATPGSLLEQKLLQGGSTSRSIPFVFSTLRNGLAKQVADYDRIRLSKTGPDRLAYAATHGPAAEYKRAWIYDIDKGLVALPAVSHKVAQAIVYNEQGTDMETAETVMKQYMTDHLLSMAGAPDGVVQAAVWVKEALELLSLPFIGEAIDAILKEPIDFLVKGVTGKTAEEWKAYLKNPETHFDEVLNRRGGAHGGAEDHPITLEAFNRQHLKIDDKGYVNPALRWKIEDLPPAFNTVQMTKMLLLGDAGMQQLDAALKAKGTPMGGTPGQFRNHMLGWVRSMDAGNQWQGRKGSKPGPSPLPAFSANNGVAFKRMFMSQTGEAMFGDGTHGSSPVPPDKAPPQPDPAVNLQDLRPWADTWATTYGELKLQLGTDGVLRGRTTIIDDYGRETGGEVFELRAGAQPGTLTGTSVYASNTARITMTMAADQESFTATAQISGAEKPSTWSGKRHKPVYRPPAGQATGSAPPGSGGPATPPPSTSTPPSTPSSPRPAPPPPASPAAFQRLENFEVRVDRVQPDGAVLWVHVTFKNISARDQWMTSGIVRILLSDTDGVTQERNQFWRPQGNPPAVFASTPLLEPGGELKARFRFAGSSAATVIIREGEMSARFPARGGF